MQVIVVPIQVDALFLKTAQQVIGAKADFSRLPYFNKEKKNDRQLVKEQQCRLLRLYESIQFSGQHSRQPDKSAQAHTSRLIKASREANCQVYSLRRI